MHTPCNNCPFRSDIEFYLPLKRKKEIVESLMHDSTFPCHKTTEFDDEGSFVNYTEAKPCIGAALFLQNVRKGGLLANLGFRLYVRYRYLNLSKLDITAPVYKSIEEFLK